MTALPEPDPESEPRLLTVAEYAELGETENGYTELQEGHILMSPSPRPVHNLASGELLIQLRPQLPSHLLVIQDVDVDLELVPRGQPGFSRRPDLVIVEAAAVSRTARPIAWYHACSMRESASRSGSSLPRSATRYRSR